MAMENQLTRRPGASPREGGRGAGNDAPLPRVSTAADHEDNEDEKVYYGFGVFMGLPLADLKAMKEDFVEHQVRSGGNSRRALPASAVVDSRAHRVEEDEDGNYERPDEPMRPPPQTRQPPNGYPREGQREREYAQEGARYAPSRGDADDGEDTHSDVGSDGSYSAQKSHSLNFILH